MQSNNSNNSNKRHRVGRRKVTDMFEKKVNKNLNERRAQQGSNVTLGWKCVLL
jgi:hypothetical protein